VVLARPFNTYGPRQSLRAIVPTVLAQALTGEPLRLGNLSPTRDLNFVTDTVRGLCACVEAADVEGEVFNLGTGKEVSVEQLARTACALIDVPCRIETEARRVRPKRSEVDRLVASAEKARVRLGWTPQVPLVEGLKITLEWLKQAKPSRWVQELQV
jgi:dTDP-glucose 4,6-dehydratase